MKTDHHVFQHGHRGEQVNILEGAGDSRPWILFGSSLPSLPWYLSVTTGDLYARVIRLRALSFCPVGPDNTGDLSFLICLAVTGSSTARTPPNNLEASSILMMTTCNPPVPALLSHGQASSLELRPPNIPVNHALRPVNHHEHHYYSYHQHAPFRHETEYLREKQKHYGADYRPLSPFLHRRGRPWRVLFPVEVSEYVIETLMKRDA